MEKQA
jgi:calcium/calmodulin-dependent protein kinase I